MPSPFLFLNNSSSPIDQVTAWIHTFKQIVKGKIEKLKGKLRKQYGKLTRSPSNEVPRSYEIVSKKHKDAIPKNENL